MSKLMFQWMIGLSLFGVVLSMYSLAHKSGFTSGALCNLSDAFNCDIVNQGPYSEIYGIPVAAIGLIGYGLFALATMVKRQHPQDTTLTIFLLMASMGGFVFALYLTSIEAFVLHAWCLICLLSQLTIAALALLSFLLLRGEKQV
jgi:uncharacterized membrane protein